MFYLNLKYLKILVINYRFNISHIQFIHQQFRKRILIKNLNYEFKSTKGRSKDGNPKQNSKKLLSGITLKFMWHFSSFITIGA